MDLLSSQLCCSRVSCIWRDDILFIHSSVSGRLGCFHFGAVMENASVDSHVQVFVWTRFQFSRMHLRSGIAGSSGKSVFNIVLLLFSRSVVSDSLQPHGLQQARLPCPSPSPRACSNTCSLSQWCHPTISSCHPFLLLPSIFPSIRVFCNELALHIRCTKYWRFSFSIHLSNEYLGLISFRIEWFDLLAVQRVFSSTAIQKLQSFSIQPSLWSNSHISTWLMEKP